MSDSEPKTIFTAEEETKDAPHATIFIEWHKQNNDIEVIIAEGDGSIRSLFLNRDQMISLIDALSAVVYCDK